MILEEIRLNDFRCFYGESCLVFSTSPDKNVTIVYAENGVGKTTLLNALLWCFYGETTDRFEKKEDILNYDAKSEGRTTASVEVLFEHDHKNYIAKRFSVEGTKAFDSREFVIQRIDENGHQSDVPTPETFINSVIPREMAAHFLFDGEHAEAFLGEKNRSSIRNAVRDILGCALIETAIEDLQAISNQFRKQIPSTAATSKIEALNNRLDTLTTQIETAEKEIGRLEGEHSSTDKQIRDIEEKLRTSSAAKELQRSRDKYNGDLVRAKSRRKEALNEVYKWLGENGRFIVSKKITEETFEFLDNEENRRGIPSPYNEEFIEDILKDMTCICGAKLEAGSEAAKKVASLLRKGANQVLRDRVSKVKGRLRNLREERAKAPGRLLKAKQRLSDADSEINTIEGYLGEIHQKLKGIDFEGIADREKRHEELRAHLSTVDRRIGTFKANINDADAETKRINREINDLAQQDKQTAIYGKRRTMCETLKGSLEVKLLEEENDARKVLRAAIRKILEATTRKALTLRMDDNYVINLVNNEGTPLPKSSGENQLLGLAFTAALVEFAKVREHAQDYKLLPGTIAPIVLDSPFGQLDDAYRKTTAEFIPKMARQVILLLSKSQGTSELIETLGSHIGTEYLLVRHNKEVAKNQTSESRTLRGETYQTAYFDSKFDGTEVKEVSPL